MILYDYADMPHSFGVDLDDADIALASLTVLSGDEVLEIVRNDGTLETYDACTGIRLHDFFDAKYVLVVNGEWQVDKERFYERKGSYDDGWARCE